MSKFLDIQNLPKLNHEDTEKLNRPKMNNKIGSIIQYLPTQKWPVMNGFAIEFYQAFIKN
jgi:hypothetical protein